jgi:hypothetical protein
MDVEGSLLCAQESVGVPRPERLSSVQELTQVRKNPDSHKLRLQPVRAPTQFGL